MSRNELSGHPDDRAKFNAKTALSHCLAANQLRDKDNNLIK